MELLILKRVLLAVLMGAMIGFERERAHKVAGLRTHMLVCVSTALLALMAQYGIEHATAESTSRIVADIMLGVGFIGGGAIMRNESHVQGTTTAATLWAVAAVGAAIGIGFTYAAVLVTLVTYLILTIFWRLEVHLTATKDTPDVP